MDDTPQTDMMQVSCFYNLCHRRIANATCGIVDDSTQSLLIIGIRDYTEVSNDILDFLALVEAQTAIDTIRNAVLAHLFLKGTALCVGAIQNSEITILCLILSTDSLDIVTHDNSLFPITIGRL